MFHDWGTICHMTLWYGKQKSAQIVAVTAQGYSTSDYVTMTHRLDLQNPSWISMQWPWNVPSGSFLKMMCQWEGQWCLNWLWKNLPGAQLCVPLMGFFPWGSMRSRVVSMQGAFNWVIGRWGQSSFPCTLKCDYKYTTITIQSLQMWGQWYHRGNELSLDDKLGSEQACLHGRYENHNVDMKSHATMITLTGKEESRLVYSYLCMCMPSCTVKNGMLQNTLEALCSPGC